MPGNTATVVAVDRAIALLTAFGEQDTTLSLSEIARRTSLDKATVLRLARTLAASDMLVRGNDASWRLGPRLAQLGARYTATFMPEKYISPLIARLSERTGESAALYVREGQTRVCLLRADSAQSIRHSARIGDALPIDKGAAGWVLLAFGGQQGQPCNDIRNQGFHLTRGERDPEVASLAVPIFGPNRQLYGSLALTGPITRFDDAAARKNLTPLRDSAAAISKILGAGDLGDSSAMP